MAAKRTSFFLHEPSGAHRAAQTSVAQASDTKSSVGHANVCRINNFDLIRLLAALHVAICHSVVHSGLYEKLTPTTLALFDILRLIPAVPIFFVVSGFLINSSFERDPSNLRGYFWRRALRIFPALWVAIGLAIACLAWAGLLGNGFSSSPTFFKWLAAQLTFLQSWNPAHFRSFGSGVVNGALWTISVELQYYLLVPIWCLLGRRFHNLRLPMELAIFTLSLSAHMFMRHSINSVGGDFAVVAMPVKALHMTLLPHLWMFMLGVWIYRHFQSLIALLSNRFAIWAMLWLITTVTGEYIIGDTTVIGSALYVVSHLLLALTTISLAYSSPSLAGRLLRGNDISYGIYIFHSLIINVLLELGYFDSLATVPLVVILAITLGFLSWKLLEKPILRFKNWEPMNKKSPPRGAVPAV